jgi:transposase-like protein
VIKCKYCGDELCYKYGKYRDVQKYRCKECGRVFSDKQDTRYKLKKYSLAKRRLAITMYLNNVGIRSIEKILNISNVLLLNWFKNIGKYLKYAPESKDRNRAKVLEETKMATLEMDELYSFVKENLTELKFGLLLLETETGEIKKILLDLK